MSLSFPPSVGRLIPTSLDVERNQVQARERVATLLEQVFGDLGRDEVVQVLHGRVHQASHDLVHHLDLRENMAIVRGWFRWWSTWETLKRIYADNWTVSWHMKFCLFLSSR